MVAFLPLGSCARSDRRRRRCGQSNQARTPPIAAPTVGDVDRLVPGPGHGRGARWSAIRSLPVSPKMRRCPAAEDELPARREESSPGHRRRSLPRPPKMMSLREVPLSRSSPGARDRITVRRVSETLEPYPPSSPGEDPQRETRPVLQSQRAPLLPWNAMSPLSSMSAGTRHHLRASVSLPSVPRSQDRRCSLNAI